MMKRRQFIRTLTTTLLAAPAVTSMVIPASPGADALNVTNTVLGPKAPRALGMTLMHEHVMVDFIGASQVSRERYNADEVFRVALPHLKQLRAVGCRTLVECTPAYL